MNAAEEAAALRRIARRCRLREPSQRVREQRATVEGRLRSGGFLLVGDVSTLALCRLTVLHCAMFRLFPRGSESVPPLRAGPRGTFTRSPAARRTGPERGAMA